MSNPELDSQSNPYLTAYYESMAVIEIHGITAENYLTQIDVAHDSMIAITDRFRDSVEGYDSISVTKYNFYPKHGAPGDVRSVQGHRISLPGNQIGIGIGIVFDAEGGGELVPVGKIEAFLRTAENKTEFGSYVFPLNAAEPAKQ